MLQTAEKAIAVPFKEFIGGMQNDTEMPSDDFKPMWVCIVWPSLPYGAATSDDALTRMELIAQNEDRYNRAQTTDIQEAAAAAADAIKSEDADGEVLQRKMVSLTANIVDEDVDYEDQIYSAVIDGNPEAAVERAKESWAAPLISGVLGIFKPILHPVETLVFGRLMKRGRTCGTHIVPMLKNWMTAASNRPKVTMMANSLGSHVLVGILKQADDLPYKIHATFFVQGAIDRALFGGFGRLKHLAGKVAGPTVATFSTRDYLLKNIFAPFHGDALGFKGFPDCTPIPMKSLSEVESDPYLFERSKFCSIDGSK